MNVTATPKAMSILMTIMRPDLTCSITVRSPRLTLHILGLWSREIP
jgi:hypothetical protein